MSERTDNAAFEAELIRRVAQGDRPAFERVYSMYSQPLMSYAMRMVRDRMLAEEVLQDTFVDIMGKIASFERRGSFAGWVRRIAVNHCLMQLRSGWVRKSRRLKNEDEMADTSSGVERISAATDIGSALAALSDKSRFSRNKRFVTS